MDQKDIRTLHILESVEREKPPSQRELARELDISLGLVNSFMRRLAKKGYFKITHIPKNRIRYLLTSKGAVEKSKLTYAYIQFSYRYYKQALNKLNLLFVELEQQNVSRIVFLGATDLAEIAYLAMKDTGIELMAVVDDRLPRKKLFGKTVKPIAQLGRINCDRILVTDSRERNQIQENLRACDISADKLVWVK